MILASHRTAFGLLVLAASGCAGTTSAPEGAPQGDSPQVSAETGCCDALVGSLAGAYEQLLTDAGTGTSADASSGFANWMIRGSRVPELCPAMRRIATAWLGSSTSTDSLRSSTVRATAR